MYLFIKATPHSLRDLSFPNKPRSAGVKVQNPNHWTTRQFPFNMLFIKKNRKQ